MARVFFLEDELEEELEEDEDEDEEEELEELFLHHPKKHQLMFFVYIWKLVVVCVFFFFLCVFLCFVFLVVFPMFLVVFLLVFDGSFQVAFKQGPSLGLGVKNLLTL